MALWDLAERLAAVPYFSLLSINSADREEEAMNEQVCSVLVKHGAQKGRYAYPERENEYEIGQWGASSEGLSRKPVGRCMRWVNDSVTLACVGS
jgi:hypothetical protein